MSSMFEHNGVYMTAKLMSAGPYQILVSQQHEGGSDECLSSSGKKYYDERASNNNETIERCSERRYYQ